MEEVDGTILDMLDPILIRILRLSTFTPNFCMAKLLYIQTI